MDYDKSIQQTVTDIMTAWADEVVATRKAAIQKKGLVASGRLLNSIKQEVSIEGGLIAKAIIEIEYYGLIQDARKINVTPSKKMVEGLKSWIETIGVGRFKNKGKGKSQHRQIHDIAWAISRSWASAKTRKGKKWNMFKQLGKERQALVEEVAAGYQNRTQEAILESFRNRLSDLK